MIKVFTLIKRRNGLSYEEFAKYWEEQHGPLMKQVLPGVKRYSQNHLVRLPGSGEPQYDGIAEMWFDDLESWHKTRKAYLGDKRKLIEDDENKFIDKSKMLFFVVEEKVII